MNQRVTAFFLILSLVILPSLAVIPPIGAEQEPSVTHIGAVSPPASLSQAGWLEGWDFRKQHTIIGSVGSGANYSVHIVVHYGIGQDAQDSVFCNGKCQPDFADIRFTDEDGFTVLGYWMEEYVYSSVAHFWCRMVGSLDSDRCMFVYYGNPAVATLSNGSEAFPLFDDFNRDNSSVVGGGWVEDEAEGSIGIEGGVLTIVQYAHHYCHIERPFPLANNFALECRVCVEPNCGWTWAPRVYAYWDGDNIAGSGVDQSLYWGEEDWIDGSFHGYSTPGASFYTWYYIRVSVNTSTAFFSYSLDGASWLEFYYSPRPSSWTANPLLVIVGKGNPGTYPDLDNSYTTSGSISTTYFDNVFVRKLTSPEPSHGNWGSEEAQNPHRDEVLVDMTTIVGLSGDNYSDSMSLLAASSLAVRRRNGITARSLVLPDVSHPYESPIDEWTSVLGESTDELLLVGSVDESKYVNTCHAVHVTKIGTSDFYETAKDIAVRYFSSSETLVLAYAAPSLSPFSSTCVVYSESNSLPDPTHTIYSLTTDYYLGETDFYLPRQGGGIVAQVSGASSYMNYLLCQLGYQDGGESYGLDYPWYGDYRMAFPNFGQSGDWRFNLIDTYPYYRYGHYTLDVWSLAAKEYPFTVAHNETCLFDFELSVPDLSECVGLYVLDPDRNLVVDANRFALISSDMKEHTIRAELWYPRPGNYTAFVTTAEMTGAEYNITITKRTAGRDLLDTGLSASNALSIACMNDAGLLFSDGESEVTSALEAICAIRPDNLIVIDMDQHFSSSFMGLLSEYLMNVTYITNLSALQILVDSLGYQSAVTLYDPLGEFFVPAGLSAAVRCGIALPIGYAGSEFMTYAQVAEQMAYHADYSAPFLGGYHYYDVYASYFSLSELHPSYQSMVRVSDSFYTWLYGLTGRSDAQTLIDIAPYLGLGSTLPPAFDRALMGKSATGRYCSRYSISTYVQIAQSALRGPLCSLHGTGKPVVGSFIAYNFGNVVATNGYAELPVENSGLFVGLMNQCGFAAVEQAGPSTTLNIRNGVFFWSVSSHGGVGERLYTDDCLLAMMNVDCSRGYDSGRSEQNPDDGDGVVNPSEDQLELWNMSTIIGGADLHGLVVYLDTCQIGSSYGPALMLEAGAESIVACWLDSYIGPSDLLERNFISSMAQTGLTISDALASGFLVNSHVYSLGIRGLNYYIDGNVLYPVASTSNQFMTFGNPTAKLFDAFSTCPPVVRLIDSSAPHVMTVTAGTSVEIPLDLYDIFGRPFAVSSLSYTIDFPNGSVLQTGWCDCGMNGEASLVITFPESFPSGRYLLQFGASDKNETCSVSLNLVLPVVGVDSFWGAIGKWVQLNLSLVSHTGAPLNFSGFSYVILDPAMHVFASGAAACGAFGRAVFTILIATSAESGDYLVSFGVPGSPHSYTSVLHVGSIFSSVPSDVRMVAGIPSALYLGLSDGEGNPIEASIYEYAIQSPIGGLYGSGICVCGSDWKGVLILDFPHSAATGTYLLRFWVFGSSQEYSVQIHVELPDVSIGAVSAPVASQLGFWQVTVNLFNGESVSIEARLEMLLSSQVVSVYEIVLPPGSSQETFTLETTMLGVFSTEASLEARILYGPASLPVTVFSKSVSIVMVGSWQAASLLFLVPISVVCIAAVYSINHTRTKRLNRIGQAAKREHEGDYSPSVFETYMKSGLYNSAMRTALGAGIPDEMITKLLRSEPETEIRLKSLALKIETSGDYRTAARLFGRLAMKVRYYTNSLLASVGDGQIPEACSVFSQMVAAGLHLQAVDTLCQMQRSGQGSSAAKVLLASPQASISVASTVAGDVRRTQAFDELLSTVDDRGLRLNVQLAMGETSKVVDDIASEHTVADMASITGLLDRQFVVAVALNVVRKLLQDRKAEWVPDYVAGLSLTPDDVKAILAPLAAAIIEDPSDVLLDNALKALIQGAKPIPVGAQFVKNLYAIAEKLRGLGTSSPEKYAKVLLETLPGLGSVEIAEVAYEKAVEHWLGRREPAELNTGSLAEFVQSVRASAYSMEEEPRRQLLSKMSSYESNLKQRLERTIYTALLPHAFSPDQSTQSAQRRQVTESIASGIDTRSPTTMIQALADAACCSSFPELDGYVGRGMTSQSLDSFVKSLMADSRRWNALLAQVRVSTPVPGGYIISVDPSRLSFLLFQKAKETWTAAAKYLWEDAVWNAMSLRLPSLISSSLPVEQNIEILAAYLSGIEKANVPHNTRDAVYESLKKLCDLARLGDMERKRLLDKAGLSASRKGELLRMIA